jgi:hypothetical protein
MIEYRFRVPSIAIFTLYSYSKPLEYPLEYPTAGSLSADSQTSCQWFHPHSRSNAITLHSQNAEIFLISHHAEAHQTHTHHDHIYVNARLPLVADYSMIAFACVHSVLDPPGPSIWGSERAEQEEEPAASGWLFEKGMLKGRRRSSCLPLIFIEGVRVCMHSKSRLIQ